MNARLFIRMAAAALLALAGALYVLNVRHAAQVRRDAPLLPGLGQELAHVDLVTIQRGGPRPSVSLRKSADRWLVTERADYPADVTKLRRLLLALADAKVVEEKTTDPANYALLAVDDPAAAGARGARVKIRVAGSTGSVIVGKSSGSANFVRRADAAQVYLVEPGIAVETEPRDWIDSRLLDVPAALIQRIEVKPESGPAYALHRISPADADFALETVPAGRTALDPKTLSPAPAAFASLGALDVAPAGQVDFKAVSTCVLALADGNVITLTGTSAGEKRWLTLTATKDAALSDKVRGRAFEISSTRYDSIFRPLERLVAPKR